MRQINIYITTFIILTFLALSFSVNANDFVVVLDAGHGGKDYGALGVSAREKDINLSVAKLLGQMINDNINNVKVVYTRDDDRFLTLQKRAQIANEANGDLFISIHTNSLDKRNKKRKTIAGASVYTLGLHRTDENLEVAKRENAVIELEEDYSTSYSGFDPNSAESYIIFELNQNKHLEQSVELASAIQQQFITTAGRKNRGVRQAGFLVLAETSMPGVLVELDFICNPTQEKFLASKSGQKKLAKAIFNAFKEYISHYNIDSKAKDIKLDQNNDNLTTSDDGNIVYKIQFMSASKKVGSKKLFKGLDPIDFYKDGATYKYTYGRTASMQDAQKMLQKVREKFPDAFIIKFQNCKRIK